MTSSPESTSEETTTERAPERAPDVAVDPGQVIRVNVRFPDKPESIHFSYLAPEAEIGEHDPGFGSEGSGIVADGDDFFHYSIDTHLMRGGVGWWYFRADDADPAKRRAKVGTFTVRDVPRALLERHPRKQEATPPLPPCAESGFDFIGLAKNGSEPSVVVGVAVAAVIGFALLL